MLSKCGRAGLPSSNSACQEIAGRLYLSVRTIEAHRRHILDKLRLERVSALNLRHPNWAWFSLFSVLSVDVYIRMLNAGWFTDPHILG